MRKIFCLLISKTWENILKIRNTYSKIPGSDILFVFNWNFTDYPLTPCRHLVDLRKKRAFREGKRTNYKKMNQLISTVHVESSQIPDPFSDVSYF